MKTLRNLYEKVKFFCIKYPALISGVFIYSYLLFCIIHFFVKMKYLPIHTALTVENIIDSFDAFPFMWLLAMVLVKIIEIRAKLYESEEKRMIAEQEIQLHQTQLKTMHEVTRGIQHHINNPLSIIILSLGSAHKTAEGYPKIIHHLDTIEEEINRIIAALSDFAKASAYTSETIDSRVGTMATRSNNK